MLSFALQHCHNFAHFACFEHGKAICVEVFPQHIVYYVVFNNQDVVCVTILFGNICKTNSPMLLLGCTKDIFAERHK